MQSATTLKTAALESYGTLAAQLEEQIATYEKNYW